MSEQPAKSLAEKFSVAGALAEAFITSRLTMALILACALLGSWSLVYTPRQDNPRIVIPAASISVELPGATPEEVEALVIRPLEGAIKQVPGVDDVFATAFPSKAAISVVFKAEENPEVAIVRLYDRVGTRRDLLPPDATAPVIRSSSVDDVPIVTLTLASDEYSDYELKRVADRIADGVRSLDDVGAIEVRGGHDLQARIELNPDRMRAFGISLNAIRDNLSASNLTVSLGETVYAGEGTEVMLDGFVSHLEELRRLVVGSYAGRQIHLSDVATLIDAPSEERTQLSRLAFGPADSRYGQSKNAEMQAVTVAIAKKEKANAVVVSKDVLERVEQMRKAFVPPGVEVVVTRDDGAFANDTVNMLIEHLLIAIAAVFLVITAFLGIRQALIVGLAIPLVLALTLGMVWLAGYSINRVTLFALILSLGLLVDDAIVVIENIHRNYSLPGVRSKREATLLATREIGNSTNLATLAVIFVFSALISVQGMSGQFFYPIGFTVPIAMVASLLVAYTVVPWAAYRWLPLEASSSHASTVSPVEGTLVSGLRNSISPLLDSPRKRKIVLLLVVVLLLASVMQPLWQFIRPAGVNGPQSWFGIEVGMLPKDNRNTFNIAIDLPENSPIEKTDRVVREVGEVLRNYPEVGNYQAWVGQSGVIDFNGMLRGSGNKTAASMAEIRVNLSDRHARDIKSAAIVLALRPSIQRVAANYPGTIIQLIEDPPGPPVRANLLAEIYGQDPDRLREFSKQVTDVFRNTWDVAEVFTSETTDVPRQVLDVDREKVALAGLTAAEVATELKRVLSGEYLGRMHLSGELNAVPIQLLIPRKNQFDVDTLSRTYVTNSQGQRIPLSELVSVKRTNADRPILRKNGERVTYVGGTNGTSMPLYSVLDMSKRLQELQLADGTTLTVNSSKRASVQAVAGEEYRLRWDGQQSQMLETYRDVSKAMLVAITLLFLSFVAYYKSFSLPVIALTAIPLGLIGVAPGHWLLQQQFSATSLVGIIALAGVVVRNSLLIIDFVLEYLHQGFPLRDAILDACAVRLRPILLTALSIVLGGMVMFLDPLFIGLAISLIFGTLAATVLTLIVIPILLYLLLRYK